MRAAGRIGSGALALLAAAAFSSSAEAKTFEVTRANDPAPGKCKRNDCSLREAVRAANARAGRDRILLPGRSYELTRLNPDPQGEDGALFGDLDVSNNRLSISHPGRGTARVRASQALNDRIFEVFAGAPLRLSKLQLVGGSHDIGGGAIRSDANLTISRSVLAGNTTSGSGGAINMDDSGDLKLIGTVLRGNRSTASTAGALRSGDGSITIRNSRFIGNRAVSSGGAIRISSSTPVTRITNSVLLGNRAADEGGAIDHDEGTLTVSRSTLASNRAESGGGAISTSEHALRISGSTGR